jgi:hypothetical protein
LLVITIYNILLFITITNIIYIYIYIYIYICIYVCVCVYIIGVSIIALYLWVECVSVSASYWLSYWSAHQLDHSSWFYLLIYICINILIVGSVTCRLVNIYTNVLGGVVGVVILLYIYITTLLIVYKSHTYNSYY